LSLQSVHFVFGPDIIIILPLLIVMQAPQHQICGFGGDLIESRTLLQLIAQFFALFFKLKIMINIIQISRKQI